MADLQTIPSRIAGQVLRKIERLEGGLVGDIKRLRAHDFAYRLRCGDYRVLFDVIEDTAMIRHVKHRSEAYD